MSKLFLGWDCANKSLAWSYLSIDTDIVNKLSKIYIELLGILGITRPVTMLHCTADNLARARSSMNDVNKVNQLYDLIRRLDKITCEFITVMSIGVEDILNGKNANMLSDVERTRALSTFLQKQNLCADVVLIEQQPVRIGAKVNNKSSIVSYQLAYHYINSPEVAFVSPKIKNSFLVLPGVDFSAILAKYLLRYKDPKKAEYAARKEHSTELLIRLAQLFKFTHSIAKIPTSILHNAADATLQILAHIKKNRLIQ